MKTTEPLTAAAPVPHGTAEVLAFTIGQRVTVHLPGTWLDGRAGTVDALTIGRRAGGMVAVRIDGLTPLGSTPVRLVDVRRLAPESVCSVCAIGGGCDCDMRDDAAGCRHWGCWGPKATNTCRGVAVELARTAAHNFARFGSVAR